MGIENSRIVVRPALEAELPKLHAMISEDDERPNLRRSAVFVAERGGEIAGFVAGRLAWRVEPLYVGERVRGAARRRTTLLLARAMDRFILSAPIDAPDYFFAVKRSNRDFQRFAEHFGCRRVLSNEVIYRRET